MRKSTAEGQPVGVTVELHLGGCRHERGAGAMIERNPLLYKHVDEVLEGHSELVVVDELHGRGPGIGGKLLVAESITKVSLASMP